MAAGSRQQQGMGLRRSGDSKGIFPSVGFKFNYFNHYNQKAFTITLSLSDMGQLADCNNSRIEKKKESCYQVAHPTLRRCVVEALKS